MCEYFSCIVTRDMKVLWLKTSTRHEDIIEEYKLKDTELEKRDFVRIEINPKDKSKATKNKKDWNFKVDEKDTLPKWFEKNKKKYEKLCWDVWKESIEIQCAFDREQKKFKGVLGFAYDNSTVEAWDNSTVKALGNSIVIEWNKKNSFLNFKSKITIKGAAQHIKRFKEENK